MHDYFYGWYFRCQGREGTVAVIPAVHVSGPKRSCSVQIITADGAWSREFPIAQFRIDRSKMIMQIGENVFSRQGIRLNVDLGALCISGLLRFGRFSEPEYDIMGPFKYIPGMECRHAVYSMEHSVDGKLFIDGKSMSFVSGRGYMEGDSGTSFPEKYIWTQHFFEKGSLMLAAATVPIAGCSFTGTVGIIKQNGKELRFATYLGASVKKMENGELTVRQGGYLLRVRMSGIPGRYLNAPSRGRMTRRIRENLACTAEYTLLYRGKTVLQEVTDCAAYEYETKEEKNEDRINHGRKDQRKIFERCNR